MSSADGYPVHDEAAVGISQLARALRHHLVLIGILALLGAIGGWLYSRGIPRTYTANSAVAVEGDRFAIPELQGALRSDNSPDPMPFVHTEMQALTSRALVQGVIVKLGMQNDPEFNPALRPPTIASQVIDAVKSVLPVQPAPAPAPDPAQAVLSEVSNALSLFQDNRSLVISAAFTARDPQLAANFLNTLEADYLDARSGRRANANKNADQVLVQRVAEVQAQLDKLQTQMRNLRNSGDIVALRAGSVGQQQVEELATAAARASVDRAQLEASWDRASALVKQGTPGAVVGVLDSPTISRLRDQESVASSKLADLSSRYGAAYPGVRSAAADLAAVRQQLNGEVNRIVTSLGTQLKVARDKEADLNRQLDAARHTGVEAENARAQVDDLQHEIDTRRALYTSLLQSEQQTMAQPTGSEAPDVRVLSAAVPPSEPSGPNSKLIAGAGGVGGLVLGCLFAVMRLHVVNGFAEAAEVTSITGMRVVCEAKGRLFRQGMAGRVLRQPSGPEMQAMHAMRERLRFASRKGSPRSILFASAIRSREAADLAAAFARAAAARGERVLLMEADLATPSLGRTLGVKSNGLSGVLRGNDDWRDATVADPLGPVDLLLADGRAADPAASLSGVPLQNLLVETPQAYDLVVLSGPLASAAEMGALSWRVDATVLMLDAKAGRPMAEEAARQLGVRSGNAVTGVLVT